MLSSSTLLSLQSINILTLAKDLGLHVNRHGKCLCPFHADKSPSLKFWPKVNGWKCFGCGEKGRNIDLVMKVQHLTFIEASHWIADHYGIVPHNPSTPQLPNPIPPSMFLSSDYVTRSLSYATPFCQSLVSAGYLTEVQMQHAADSYRLGATTDGGVIFWMIDQDGHVRDGKIMFYQPDCHRDHQHHPTWVSYRLRRQGQLGSGWQASPCLFGLHLLGQVRPEQDIIIAVVESEKTAIICSQLLPDSHGLPVVWLATGGCSALTAERLTPILGHRIILFPDTDPAGQTYRIWADIAQQVSQQSGQSIYVSPLLEECATAEQKQAKIDIADLLFLKT